MPNLLGPSDSLTKIPDMVTKSYYLKIIKFPNNFEQIDPSGNIDGFQDLNYFRLASIPTPPPPPREGAKEIL